MSEAPIGVFDSGVGGLSVVLEMQRALPHESILYVADSANAPWGDKSPEFVRDRGLKIGRFLVARGVKAIVIASNTGTAGSADALREALTIPVVAMEPGIKPAVAQTRSGVVGVMVTTTMNGSDRMSSLLERFAGKVRVLSQPVPGLVEHVEAGDLESEELRRLVEGYVRPLVVAGADTIVLGSTHYVFLRRMVESVAGPGVTLIDTGPAVANRLVNVLNEKRLRAGGQPAASEIYLTSGDPDSARKVMSTLLGRPVPVDRLPETELLLKGA